MPKRKSFTGDLFAPETGQGVNESEDRNGVKNLNELKNLTDPTDQSDSSTSSIIADLPGSQSNTHKTHHTHIATRGKPVETKSKRLNLLVRPGVLKEFAKIAHMQQTSVNELLNRLMADHNEKEAATIRQYDRLFIEKRSD